MKKKILIITLLGAIISILIYFYTKNDEITIVSLGDGLAIGMTPYNIKGYSYNDYLKEHYENIHQLKNYIPEFAEAGTTTKELIYKIKENKSLTTKEETIDIKHAINEANILTLAIGMDELHSKKFTREVITEYQKDLTELLNLIKTLNYNTVIIIGLYPTNNREILTIAKLNAYIRDIALSNNFLYLDITSIKDHPEYFLNPQSYYINYQGHSYIYHEIKQLIS